MFHSALSVVLQISFSDIFLVVHCGTVLFVLVLILVRNFKERVAVDDIFVPNGRREKSVLGPCFFVILVWALNIF